MQLCKYLCRFGRVAYNSMEEGACLTMQDTLRRFGMMEVNRRFLLIDNESIEQLSLRLKRQKSPDFVVIDSFQYTQMTYRQYIEFKERHRNKLMIFISHASGRLPTGRSGKSVMFDASLKSTSRATGLSARDASSVRKATMTSGRKRRQDIGENVICNEP